MRLVSSIRRVSLMPQSLQSNAPSSPLLHKGVVDRQLRQMVLVDESLTVAVGALICLSPGSKGEAGGSGSTEALIRCIGFPPFAKFSAQTVCSYLLSSLSQWIRFLLD